MIDKSRTELIWDFDAHGFQHLAADFLWEEEKAGLWIDLGMGKAGVGLRVLDRIAEDNMFADGKALVTGPISVVSRTWPDEFLKWDFSRWMNWSLIRADDDDPEVISEAKKVYQQHYRDLRDFGESAADAAKIAKTLSGRASTAHKERLRVERASSTASVHLIDDGSLEWLVDLYSDWKIITRRGKKRRQRIVRPDWPYGTLIYDEASRCKNHDTGRFKALAAVRQRFTRLIEMTATPRSQSEMGLFTQMYLIDGGERLGKNITAYRNRFFVPNKYSHGFKIMPGAADQIADIIADKVLVMKASDYLNQEEPIEIERPVVMTDEQMRIYKDFERDFIMELPDEEIIEAKNAASLSNKLLQLGSGFIYKGGEPKFDEDGAPLPSDKSAHQFHDHKIVELKAIVDELAEEDKDQPLLVAYWFQESLDRLKKAFPKAVVADKKGDFVPDWNAGKIKMLLIHPASNAYGLNMQYGPGHDVAFYDIHWSYEKYSQLIGRLARQGQKRLVRVWLIVCRGTDDKRVTDRLRDNKDAQDIMFKRVKLFRRRQREKARAVSDEGVW